MQNDWKLRKLAREHEQIPHTDVTHTACSNECVERRSGSETLRIGDPRTDTHAEKISSLLGGHVKAEFG